MRVLAILAMCAAGARPRRPAAAAPQQLPPRARTADQRPLSPMPTLSARSSNGTARNHRARYGRRYRRRVLSGRGSMRRGCDRAHRASPLRLDLLPRPHRPEPDELTAVAAGGGPRWARRARASTGEHHLSALSARHLRNEIAAMAGGRQSAPPPSSARARDSFLRWLRCSTRRCRRNLLLDDGGFRRRSAGDMDARARVAHARDGAVGFAGDELGAPWRTSTHWPPCRPRCG